ncbi:MAG: DUF5671 domain-containing protein [Anaerolineae bacterium]|nr:DUF5671 domain-containing protein [Anaerolineae bacterium]
MRTIRRLYFYLVAFISLETIVWGGVYLAQTLFKNSLTGQPSELAGGFSLVLVGLPIFGLHWWVLQRDAAHDEEERTARIRAFYFYGVRLVTLVPLVISAMSILNRLMLQAVGLNPSEALLGGTETLADNLVIIGINLVALLYFEYILRADWKINPAVAAFIETRRLFRYIWMLFTYVLMITGVQQILFAFCSAMGINNLSNQVTLANGITYALLGTPLWASIWFSIQRLLPQSDEGRSWLRLVVLHLLSLTGAVTTIFSAYMLLRDLGLWLTGTLQTPAIFVSEHNISLSLLVVMSISWGYFEGQLRKQVALEENPVERAAQGRFYLYFLAALGFGFLFTGLFWVGRILIDLLLNTATVPALREDLNGATAALLVGLVVWLGRWRRAQVEAYQSGELGEHTRRSIVRKTALYLAVFGGVVGVMAAAGSLFFLVLNSALGGYEEQFVLELCYRLEALLVVAVWLVYYLMTLIKDGRFLQAALTQRYAAYGVTLLGLDEAFAQEFKQTLQRIAPGMPVNQLNETESLKSEDLQTTQVLVLPLELAVKSAASPDALLAAFGGRRVLVPLPVEGWVWLGQVPHSRRDLARQAAQNVRQLAEGLPIRANVMNPWMVALVIMGVIFALQLLFVFVMMGVSLLVR